MPNTRLILVVASLAWCLPALSDDCPAASQVVAQALQDTLKIQRRATTQESLSQWFYSKEFESLYKNSATGLSITVPLKGIPVTFGGSHESSNAWQKRSTHSSSSEWGFNQELYESIASTSMSDVVKNRWIDEIGRCGSLVSGSVQSTGSDVQATFSARLLADAGAPVFVNFTCSGLDCTEANRILVGKRVIGTTVNVPWVAGVQDGSIAANTSRGSVVLRVSRPSPTVLLTYLADRDEAFLKGTKVIATTPVAYMHNVACSRACFKCSDDGKWCAAALPVYMGEADPGNEWRNVSMSCISGSGCAMTKQLPVDYASNLMEFAQRAPGAVPASGGRAVRAGVYTWTGDLSVWQVTAEIWGQRTISELQTKPIAVAQGRLVVSLPKGARDPHLTVISGGAPVTLSIASLPSDAAVTLLATRAGPLETVYEYQLK